jgi:defect in organelle trafficking protein DotB
MQNLTRLTEFNVPPFFQEEDQFKSLIYEAVMQGCSDIFLQPFRPALILKNQNLYSITERTLSETELTSFVMWVSGRATATTDIAEGQSVDARYEIFDRSGKKDQNGNRERFAFRVNISGILSYGMTNYQIVMRLIPNMPPKLNEVGLSAEFVKEQCTPENGMILVCGQTGSGKSTTFAAIIRYILENDTKIKGNIITAEQPIEYTYELIKSNHSVITQSEIPTHFKTFALANEAAMRRRPNLAMIGELRDAETIQAAVELSLTGHPVFATVHSNTVATVVKRMISRFPPNLQMSAIADIVETTRLIIAQRLIPKCHEEGLIAVREHLQFTQEIRQYLASLKDVSKIVFEIDSLVKSKGVSFKHQANELYAQGLISKMWKERLSILDREI